MGCWELRAIAKKKDMSELKGVHPSIYRNRERFGSLWEEFDQGLGKQQLGVESPM
jgi:hypothetical protein